jgi:hypothetical protein
MANTRKATTTRTERPTRIPVSGEGRNILSINDQDPNYVYRWVNDVEGRIDRFKAGGYEFVHSTDIAGDRSTENASNASTVLSKKVGNGITAYAMRIKREWYEEDQASKAKAIDDKEESLFRELNKQEVGLTGSVKFERK